MAIVGGVLFLVAYMLQQSKMLDDPYRRPAVGVVRIPGLGTFAFWGGRLRLSWNSFCLIVSTVYDAGLSGIRGAAMTGKQIGGVVCILVAVLFTVSGVSSLTKGDGPAVNDNSGLGVSRAVGSFLPGLVALIIGLWLFKKSEPVSRDSRRSGDE